MVSEGEYEDEYDYHYYRKCVPNNEWATFWIFYGDGHLDLFSWEILDKYRNVVASKSNYEDGYTHYYFG